MSENKVLPYKHEYSNTYYNRLIVEPIKIPGETTEGGLIIPEREFTASQVGRVYATCEGSDFKVGDEVQYRKSDRCGNEKMDAVTIEGKDYDLIYEHKIWVVNDKPYNQLFIEVMSDLQVSEGGLHLPADVQSITRKGIVFEAPPYLDIQVGDKVEYQNQLAGAFPTAMVDGKQYEVIFFSDLFTINGKVAPFRVIVKIDRAAQSIKRNTTAAGLKLSPLFIAMLRNLQYGEVVGMGAEARKMFPELHVGDTAIIDHGVESQDYRLIKYDLGKEKNATYEYRIINCYSFADREIFGKLHFKKGTNKIISITPLNGCIFFKWEFDVFDGGNKKSSVILSTEDDLQDYHNIEDLMNVVKHKRAEAAQRAKLKVSGIKQTMVRLDPLIPQQKEQLNLLSAEFAAIEREEKRIAAYLHKDHWVVCEAVYPRQLPPYVVTPHEPLYHINLLGHKYLIGHEDYLLFQTHKNMNIQAEDLIALSDNVLVLPWVEENTSGLVLPQNAVPKPQYGTVVKIGDNANGVKSGDFVLFRQYAGLQQEVGGVDHLIMKQNDLLLVLPKKDFGVSEGDAI